MINIFIIFIISFHFVSALELKETFDIVSTISTPLENPSTQSLNNTKPVDFCIGIELQEISHLCLWALENPNIQKKSIFEVYFNAESRLFLWKVVLDGSDIEFVTDAFCNQDKEIITMTMNSIQRACDVLLLFDGDNTFQDWMNGFIVHNDSPLGSMQQEGIINVLQKLDNRLEIVYNNQDVIYSLVKDNRINYNRTTSRGFMFNPQITFQFPLEFTIPLLVNLFCPDNFLSLSDSLSLDHKKSVNLSFEDILTVSSYFQDDIFDYDLTSFYEISKEINYTFIFMLYMYQLSPQININNTQNIEDQLISSLIHDYREYHQVNPKRNLLALSRRPFSEIWQNVVDKTVYPINFQGTLEDLIKEEYIKKIKERIEYISYGKRYVSESHTPVLFESFLNILNNIPIDEQTKISIRYLLEKGIICTSMIRILPSDNQLGITNEYYKDIFWSFIKSIDIPAAVQKPYIFTQNNQFKKILWDHHNEFDLLSPLPFIPDSDSMGKYKNLSPEQLGKGEMIVEIRDIRGIGGFLRNKIHNKFTELSTIETPIQQNQFLTKYSEDDKTLQSMIIHLLSVLEDNVFRRMG